jgi:VanZ family protein
MTKIHWTYLIAAITLFILMLALGSYPGNAQALTEKINDKILHFLAYSLLTALIYLSLNSTKREKFFITLCIMFALSLTDEYIQSMLSFRTASLLDLSVDLLAAGLMTSCLSLLPITNDRACNS